MEQFLLGRVKDEPDGQDLASGVWRQVAVQDLLHVCCLSEAKKLINIFGLFVQICIKFSYKDCQLFADHASLAPT